MTGKSPLTFQVLSKCSRTKARRGMMMLRQDKPVETPGENKKIMNLPALIK